MPGRGTREHILNIKQIIEKLRVFNKPGYLCFVDYQKAFDQVRWDSLWSIMTEMGTPQHITRLIANLYKAAETQVKVQGQLSDRFKVYRGLRQGCILSPILFNLYGEWIIRKAAYKWDGGIAVGGRKIYRTSDIRTI